ncbi:hypothetical protein LJC63_02345 [Ruminococcaceae bacterium OttesenSCG-928-L11]|nr:hypothetical protein [Ruminococcaceae bacterium OttesenSCG-928-L11]
MLFLSILVLILFGWPPIHQLVLYYKKSGPNPTPKEAAGIITCTVVMVVYLGALLWLRYFF